MGSCMRGQPAPELGAWHHLLGTVGVRSSSSSADVVVEFVVQVEQGQTGPAGNGDGEGDG